MRRLSIRFLVLLALGLVAVGPARAGTFSQQDLSIPMDDGVSIAATLFTPDGTPPSTGWPAVVLFHGLGQSRASTNPIAATYFAPEGYSVLTFDARGQGASGGLSSIDGPREMQDVHELFQWLTSRPEIDAAHVGAFGMSLGGGGVWRSTVDGVPWAAIAPVITWTDLYSALAPGNLAKSGAVYGFLQEVPADRSAPELNALRTDAIRSENLGALRTFADARSSLGLLDRIHIPVFMLQGRRDFAFDIDQAAQAFTRLTGPKRLYVGDLGHSPAANPVAEQPHYLGEAREWFDRWLKGIPNGIDTRPPVEVAPDPWTGTTYSYAGLPPSKTLTISFRGSTVVKAGGRAVRTAAPLKSQIETFGIPILKVSASTSTAWPHLVVVLSALTTDGKEIVVSEGGIAPSTLTKKPHSVTMRLIDDATPIPSGSRLRLTLAASSTAQNPGNLLYLDIGMSASSRLTVGNATLQLPVLRKTISR